MRHGVVTIKDWHLITKLNGVDTREYDIYQRDRVVIPTPEQDVQRIEIKGRSGSLTKKFSFKDIILPINFFFYEETSFKKAYRRFKIMLFNAKTLMVNDDEGIFYKIKSVSIENALNDILEMGEFTVNFTLNPFQYELNNEPIIITSQQVINNEGYEALPVITATCSGTGKIYINDQEITIQNINGTITIDSEMQNAYRIAGGYVTNLNKHMIGKFPVLEHGDNVISFDGDITKLEIICNRRWV